MSIRSASARSSTDAVVLESTVVSDDSGGARVREARPARLVVVTGSSAGSAIPLGNDETTVGRAPSNEVVLPDISVSRRHALLRRERDGYVLIDQGSGNGTRLNGRSVQVTRLGNGDEVTLGDAVVQFVEAGRVAARERIAGRHLEDVLHARTSDALRGISAMSPRLRFGAAFVLVGLLLTVAVAGLGGKNGASAIRQRTVPATVAASGEPSQADEVRPPSVDPARTDALAQESAGGENDEHTAAAASAKVVWSRTAAMQVRSAYARGDLEKAIALARALATPRLLSELEKFSSSWREGIAQASDHRRLEAIAALERAEAADAAIGGATGGALSQKIRKSLARLHAEIGATQVGAGQLAAAAAHLRAALRYDPRDDRAGAELQRIVLTANDTYLRGYVAKDIDEEVAREAFRAVLALVPASDSTAQKARRWLERLEGKAEED